MFSTTKIYQPVSNRTKKKSKQGCKTCKARKVKCDEQRPVCGKCKIYYSDKIATCDFEYPFPPTGRDGHSTARETRTGALKKRVTYDPNLGMKLPRRRQLLPSQVGGVVLDPFNTSSRSDLPYSQQLLHHYLSSILGKCLPAGHTPDQNPLIRGLWALIQADNFYHNVILQVSAVGLEMLQGKPNAMQSERYARESIRILRERIAESTKSVSDQTISAVATLATLEYEKNNMITMKMHVDGLKRMIAMRGGLSKVRASSQTTATMVHWFTMLLMQDSIFPPEERDDLSVEEPSRLFSMDPAPQYISLQTLDIEDGVIALLERTRRVSEHFASGQLGTLESPDDFHWQFNSLLQRLCHLKVHSATGSSTAIYTEACRYANAMFLFLPFHDHYPDPRLVLNSFLHKLKAALRDLVPSLGSQSQFLLWLLGVGGVVSQGVPEHEWIIGHLVPIVAHLELRSFEEFITTLEGIVYIRQYLDDGFRTLWEDIMSATEQLAEQDPYTNIILDMRGSSTKSMLESERSSSAELVVHEDESDQ